MARQKYVQWTPIGPLNLFGRIDATVVGLTAPIYDNQMVVAEDTQVDGYLVDLTLMQLVLP
jgi:hypothetical protein